MFSGHISRSTSYWLTTQIDAVTIASPIGLHYEHCRLALEAGKHVHVNKTLCTTVAEADALIELARTRNLRIVASPGEALRPQLRRTRELIEEGAIGELAWAICGGAFESYHEQDEPERINAPGGEAINPGLVLRQAWWRPDVRHHGLLTAPTYDRARPGPTRNRDVRDPHSGTAVSRGEDHHSGR